MKNLSELSFHSFSAQLINIWGVDCCKKNKAESNNKNKCQETNNVKLKSGILIKRHKVYMNPNYKKFTKLWAILEVVKNLYWYFFGKPTLIFRYNPLIKKTVIFQFWHTIIIKTMIWNERERAIETLGIECSRVLKISYFLDMRLSFSPSSFTII